ncbi:MAG: DNA internalization-related competence protein ComEC/Rec2 [Desulfobacterales bacterium]|nr:MAG: DNA internalization-related competence protein ComEC/Rec2 [Desulfobacterales bacterium]
MNPVCWPLGGLIAGASAGYHFPGGRYSLVLFLSACLLLSGWWISVGRRRSFCPPDPTDRSFSGHAIRLLPALAGLVLFFHAAASISLLTGERVPQDHIAGRADGAVHTVTGVIRNLPEESSGRFRALLNAESVDGVRASGLVRISWSSAMAGDLLPGDRIRFQISLRRIRNFVNPGGGDYRKWMACRGIRVSGWIRKGSLKRISSGRLPFPWQWTAYRRAELQHVLSGIPGEAGAILTALVIGVRSRISPELREQFVRAGIAHLLAISGLHIGMIWALAYGIALIPLSRIPYLLWNHLSRPAAAVTALIPAGIYTVLAGCPPSALRAFLMTGAAAVLISGKRPADALVLLAWVAVILLTVSPAMLFSPSFLLSFAAVFTILAGIRIGNPSRLQSPGGLEADSDGPGRRRTRLRNIFRFLKSYVLSSLWISLLAILGTLPVTMSFFHQISFNGLAANPIFIPLTGFLVLPCALAGAGLSWLWPAAGSALLQLSALILNTGFICLPLFSNLPFSRYPTISPTILEIIWYYGLLAFLYVILRKRLEKKRNGTEESNRRLIYMALFLLLAFPVGNTIHWHRKRFQGDTLRVTVLDVGQGSAALAELPGGGAILIDGGGFYDNRIFDVGKWIIARVLIHKRIFTIDVMVLSHPDGDHMNGLQHISRYFSVREAWLNGSWTKAKIFHEIARNAGTSGAVTFMDGQIPDDIIINGITVRTFCAMDYAAAGESAGWRDNNRSLLVRLAHKNFTVLLPGDIEVEAEAILTARAPGLLSADVLIAPHHGCASSGSQEFISAVHPQEVVISCGFKNRYGCPRNHMLDRYGAGRRRIFRTDLDGAVVLSSSGKRIQEYRMRNKTR